MKRIILILAMVVVATISYGQGKKYNVSRVVFAHAENKQIVHDNVYVISNLHLTMSESYVIIDDEANSIYRQNGEISITNLSNINFATYDALDKKDNKVICNIVYFKEEKRLAFYIFYGTDVIIYELEEPLTGLQKLE